MVQGAAAERCPGRGRDGLAQARRDRGALTIPPSELHSLARLTHSNLLCQTQTGDLLEAVETATNATGQLRVRFSEGWTSTESSTGVQILQRCDSVGTPLRKTRPGPEADPDLE